MLRVVVARGMWGGGAGYGQCCAGHATMGQWGTMGHGIGGMGMMGGGIIQIYPPYAEPIALDEVRRRLDTHAVHFGPEARVADVMAFINHYYAQILGADGFGLAEVLVDRFTGVVQPEPGPNMMWNAAAPLGGRGTLSVGPRPHQK